MCSRAQIIEIDLAGISTEQGLHNLLMQRLELPDYYGKNWDAFWDVITEPDRLPHVLILRGWLAFEQRLPATAQLLRELLRDVSIQYSDVDCRVEYA